MRLQSYSDRSVRTAYGSSSLRSAVALPTTLVAPVEGMVLLLTAQVPRQSLFAFRMLTLWWMTLARGAR